MSYKPWKEAYKLERAQCGTEEDHDPGVHHDSELYIKVHNGIVLGPDRTSHQILLSAKLMVLIFSPCTNMGPLLSFPSIFAHLERLLLCGFRLSLHHSMACPIRLVMRPVVENTS